jgi:hypothetical protein
MDDDSAGPRIVFVIEQHLAEEFLRKSSLEQRAVTAITSAGAFTTFLVSVLTIVRSARPGFSMRIATPFAPIGLTSFALGVIAAIIALSPIRYRSLNPRSLRPLLKAETFRGPGNRVDRRLAELRLMEFESLRFANNLKAAAVVSAFSFITLALAVMLSGALKSS